MLEISEIISTKLKAKQLTYVKFLYLLQPDPHHYTPICYNPEKEIKYITVCAGSKFSELVLVSGDTIIFHEKFDSINECNVDTEKFPNKFEDLLVKINVSETCLMSVYFLLSV